MNNIKKIKQHFYKVIFDYINNSFDQKKNEYLKYLYTLNLCERCPSSQKRTSIMVQQNINSDLMIIVDPYFLYSSYNPKDKKKIDELFLKILKSIDLELKNIYITSTIKCLFQDKHREDQIDCDFMQKELEIIAPKYILLFGKYAKDTFFADLKIEQNSQTLFYHYKDSKIFCTHNPIEIFNNPDLKKEVWQYLKRFIKEYHN